VNSIGLVTLWGPMPVNLEAFTEVLLRILIYNMALCGWLSGSWCFKGL
jgi:hypothetical protein